MLGRVSVAHIPACRRNQNSAVHACMLSIYLAQFWLSLSWLCWSLLFVVSCTEEKLPTIAPAVCCEMSGRKCKVTLIVLEALKSFSVLTDWSKPLISFMCYEETINCTMYLGAIFVCHSCMCHGKEKFCKLNYCWYKLLIFLWSEGTI